MRTNDSAGLESRYTSEAMRVIERADSAVHDPAQYQLHEFPGGERL
jgi:hypothetical protein